jgi:hypothetical protein
MNDGQQPDAADVLASIGRHWGWIMAFGVLTLLAGVAVLAWPGRTLVVIAVLFGVQLIVTGRSPWRSGSGPSATGPEPVLSMPSEGAAPCR